MDQNKKHLKTSSKIILLCLALLLLAIAVFIGYYYNRIVNAPADLFNNVPPAATPSSVISAAPSDGLFPATPPAPTPDEYEQLLSQADLSMLKDIVNVLVIGVDYAQERETWRGKHAYHSDVMIVLALNFKENTVDMISLPRDTYANIPGVDGIYKLNAAIDCGGGYPEGLPKVAEAASWMLGGIPVDYYYAVTMPVVKDLVDAIGGVEYNVDVDFKMMGRSYKKGPQFMNGQAVLDYFRVRKNVQAAGDLNRVNRQKKMLVAIFEKMKSQNMLVKIPQLIKAFDGQLLTNTTLEQTAALSVFAYSLPSENIKMHSMGGAMRNIFNWNFCLTNQSDRVKLIKSIYGIDVPAYKEYSLDYCLGKWAKMRSVKYFANAERVIAAAEKLQPASPADPAEHSASPSSLPSGMDMQLAKTKDSLANCKTALDGSGSEADAAIAALQSETQRLAALIGYTGLDWGVSYINDVKVDFR